jgi:hypothetical protein
LAAQPLREGFRQRLLFARRPRLPKGARIFRKPPKHRIDESGDTWTLHVSHEVDALANYGERRHAVEEEQLIRAQEQVDAHQLIHGPEPSLHVSLDAWLQPTPHAERTEHELGGKRSIPSGDLGRAGEFRIQRGRSERAVAEHAPHHRRREGPRSGQSRGGRSRVARSRTP